MLPNLIKRWKIGSERPHRCLRRHNLMMDNPGMLAHELLTEVCQQLSICTFDSSTERNLWPEVRGACMHRETLRGSFSAVSNPIFQPNTCFSVFFEKTSVFFAICKILTFLQRAKFNNSGTFLHHSADYLTTISDKFKLWSFGYKLLITKVDPWSLILGFLWLNFGDFRIGFDVTTCSNFIRISQTISSMTSNENFKNIWRIHQNMQRYADIVKTNSWNFER